MLCEVKLPPPAKNNQPSSFWEKMTVSRLPVYNLNMKLWVFLKTSKEARLFLALLGLGVALYILGGAVGDKTDVCKNAGGNWLKKYYECENINLIKCTEINGLYSFCASPCRHYKEESIADKCEFKCTQVCEFIRFSRK